MMASKQMKRKDIELDDVSDDFSDFSLASPARKIRRLDLGLPPIIEEEEADVAMSFSHQLPEGGQFSTSRPVDAELPANDERAIVLFNPASSHLSPGNFSIDHGLVSDLKYLAVWKHRPVIVELDDEEDGTNKMEGSDECLAVIPWAPPQLASQKPEDEEVKQLHLMEAEDTDVAAMEIEDNYSSVGGAGQTTEWATGHDSSMQHFWQQQHCMTMIPQSPQNIVSPIIWYR